jgi:N-methylhydantoinase B/oxoprolinase/acetone carboxylase alpha subunit
LIVKALSEAIPDRCPAASYQMFGCVFYRMDPRHGQPFIFIEPLEGGGGWGDPAERDPARIDYDLRNGYIEPEQS